MFQKDSSTYRLLYFIVLGLLAGQMFFSVLRPAFADIFFILLFLLSVILSWKTIRSSSLMGTERVWLVWLLISSVISIVLFLLLDSGKEARYRLEDDIKFTLLIPLYFLLLKVQIRQSYIIVFLLVLTAVLGCVSLIQAYGMFEYKEFWLRFDHTGRNFMYRPSGSVNPMRYAAISLIVAATVFAYLLINWGKIRNKSVLACFVAIGLGFVACLLTQTRGVWLAILALIISGLIVFFMMGYRKGVLVTAIISFFVILSASQISSVEKKINTTIHQFDRYLEGKSNTSVGTRLDMYVVSWGLFKQSPIYGNGLNAFKTKTKEMRGRGEFKGMSHELGVRHTPHNEFLMAAVEKGIIGIILVFGLFAIPFVIFYRALMYGSTREAKWYGACGAIMVTVLFVAGQTGTIFNHNVFTHFYIIWTFLFVSQIKHVAPEVLEWKKLDVKPLKDMP